MKPPENREYLKGALYARDFLRRTQADVQLHRRFRPQVLRWEYEIAIQNRPAQYQAGFLDAMGAYVITTLEGVLVDLYRWQLLRELERADQ